MIRAQQKEEPTITAIATFYNLESCVKYCVDGLLSQEYAAAEFLLIDDGSTDGTAEQLDEYAEDPRVKVFHKPNGGLSDARNFGVRHATGDYVTFIDGDDIVSPRYLARLAAGIKKEKKTLVTSGFKVVSTNPNDYDWSLFQTDEASYTEKSRKDALVELLYEDIKASAPAKLAPCEFYRRHPFPVGVYYEEISTAAHYISMADCVVKYEGEEYGYVMRENSITHKKAASVDQAKDMLRAIAQLERKCWEIIGDHQAFCYQESLQMSRLFWLLRAVPACDEKGAIEMEARKRLEQAYPGVMRDAKVGVTAKIRFSLLRYFPKIYTLLFSIYEKKKIA